MQSIQIVVQRMMWASGLCLALILYHVPTRALPMQLGEATKLNQMVWITHLAQRLGTEVGIMMEHKNAYMLTRSLEQACWANQCTQQIKPITASKNSHLNPSRKEK